MPQLYPCVTCGQQLNLLEGLNCQRCAAQENTQQAANIPLGDESLAALRKKRALALATDLATAFPWVSTKQGTYYWGEVFSHLMSLSQGEGWE
jgi:hypothetical protein